MSSNGNPSFWGGYVEAGYFLTGETRGYKAGAWDRTKVLKPFSKGGFGAVQVIGRVDYLDLDCEQAAQRLHQQLRHRAELHHRRVAGGQGRQAARPPRRPDLDPRGLYARAAQLLARLRSRRPARGDGRADLVASRSTSANIGVDTVQARFQIDF